MTDPLAVNGAVNVPHHVPCEQVEQGSGHASQSFHDPMTVVTLQITFFHSHSQFLAQCLQTPLLAGYNRRERFCSQDLE